MRIKYLILNAKSSNKFLLLIVIIFNQSYGIGTGFLTNPSTARELALGPNPVIAVTPTGNPACLASFGKGPELLLTYGSWLADVTETNIGISHRFNLGTGGIRIRYSGLDDLELRTDRPVDNPVAYFGVYGAAFDGIYARQSGLVRWGIAVRMLTVQLYTESATGWAVDLGLVHRMNNNLSLGAAVLNMGAMSILENQSPQLPLRLSGGFAYRYDMLNSSNNFSVTAEWLSQIRGSALHIGNEIHWKQVTVQLGSQFSEKVVSISGGFGLQIGIYGIQYGIRVGSQNLGIPQMIDVSVRLP